MAKYKITQCEISTAESRYQEAIKTYEEAKNNICNEIVGLIKMLNHLDYNLLKLKTQMQITYIDGEEVSFYQAHSVEVGEDNTIIVYTNDDFTEDVEFNLYDLSIDEIYCLGALLFEQYQIKYGEVMTYEDMVEASKKIV